MNEKEHADLFLIDLQKRPDSWDCFIHIIEKDGKEIQITVEDFVDMLKYLRILMKKVEA